MEVLSYRVVSQGHKPSMGRSLFMCLWVVSQGHKPSMGRSQLICTGGSLMVTVQYSNDYKDDKNEALHTQYIFRTDVPHGGPAFHAAGTVLVTDRDDLMIRVRICRMWDAINSKKNRELISLDMIFVNEKGNLAHAIVRKNHVSTFKHKLIKGSLFIIKNFKVVESSDVYRPVENSLKIIFFPLTVIKSLSEDIIDIPMNEFHFSKQELIEPRVNNNTLLSVRNKITDIINYFRWYYISYNVCSKKITPANSVYPCLNCNKDCKFPLLKYKIHIQVEDNTKKTTFVLFNDVAEKFIDISTHKLFNKLSSLDNNDVPAHIQSLCGKYFIFKLKLNRYNLKEGLENFIVSKLWIPAEKLELDYKLKREKKNLIEDESEPEDHVPKKLSTEKVSSCHGKDICQSSNGGVIKHKRSIYKQRPNMTPKKMNENSAPGSATEEVPPLYGRNHMTYRYAYFPAKEVLPMCRIIGIDVIANMPRQFHIDSLECDTGAGDNKYQRDSRCGASRSR
ncbi:hypothetical protein BC332_25751 [Capsicum chinense]|nr:hypothetical protein BC332_25751 [Capsicum chinense]